MDDILVYIHLQQVFQLMQDNHFYIKLSKCEFARQELEYSGHIVSANGVATEPSKVKAVEDWPMPSSPKELRGFLGLTGYYRRFIRNHGMISRPLTQLLKKGTQFQWTPVTQEAFLLLK